VTARPTRSTSRRSSASHSSGRSPVPAAKIGIASNGPSSSATASISSHDSNGRISARRGSGLGTNLAGFSSISFQRTPAFKTCRNATIASCRCPSGSRFAQAPISSGSSSRRRTSPKAAVAFFVIAVKRAIVVRGGLMLGKVALDQRGDGPVPACSRERAEPSDVERVGQRVGGLALRLEAAPLASAAVLVAVAVGPGAAAEFVNLTTLDARHDRPLSSCPPSVRWRSVQYR
jgi:hypothetical protein